MCNDIHKITNLQNKFNKAGLLPGVNFRGVSVAGWVTSCGKKCKRGALVACNVYHATFLPKFGEIETVFLDQLFIYFEVSLYNTVQLNEILQSYEITESLYIVELKSSFSHEKNISGEIGDTL